MKEQLNGLYYLKANFYLRTRLMTTMKRLNLCVCGCADLYITATNYTYDQYTQRVRISKLKNDIESILRDESKNKRRKQYEA